MSDDIARRFQPGATAARQTLLTNCHKKKWKQRGEGTLDRFFPAFYRTTKHLYPPSERSSISNIVEATDDNGNTCLHIAAVYGQAEVVDGLLKLRAGLYARNGDGQLPIHLAALGNHTSAIALLTAACPILLVMPNERGQTPMHLATEKEHLNMMEWLYLHGVPLDCTDSEGKTPLHRACIKGNVRAAQFLLIRGADPLAEDLSGRTALHVLNGGKAGALLRSFVNILGARGGKDEKAKKKDDRGDVGCLQGCAVWNQKAPYLPGPGDSHQTRRALRCIYRQERRRQREGEEGEGWSPPLLSPVETLLLRGGKVSLMRMKGGEVQKKGEKGEKTEGPSAAVFALRLFWAYTFGFAHLFIRVTFGTVLKCVYNGCDCDAAGSFFDSERMAAQMRSLAVEPPETRGKGLGCVLWQIRSMGSFPEGLLGWDVEALWFSFVNIVNVLFLWSFLVPIELVEQRGFGPLLPAFRVMLVMALMVSLSAGLSLGLHRKTLQGDPGRLPLPPEANEKEKQEDVRVSRFSSEVSSLRSSVVSAEDKSVKLLRRRNAADMGERLRKLPACPPSAVEGPSGVPHSALSSSVCREGALSCCSTVDSCGAVQVGEEKSHKEKGDRGASSSSSSSAAAASAEKEKEAGGVGASFFFQRVLPQDREEAASLVKRIAKGREDLNRLTPELRNGLLEAAKRRRSRLDSGYARGVTELAADADDDSLQFYWTRRVCLVCGIRRTDSSKHCRDCGRCVERFDHHCQWMSNCIGLLNHRAFLHFLIFSFLGLLISVLMCAVHFWLRLLTPLFGGKQQFLRRAVQLVGMRRRVVGALVAWRSACAWLSGVMILLDVIHLCILVAMITRQLALVGSGITEYDTLRPGGRGWLQQNRQKGEEIKAPSSGKTDGEEGKEGKTAKTLERSYKVSASTEKKGGEKSKGEQKEEERKTEEAEKKTSDAKGEEEEEDDDEEDELASFPWVLRTLLAPFACMWGAHCWMFGECWAMAPCCEGVEVDRCSLGACLGNMLWFVFGNKTSALERAVVQGTRQDPDEFVRSLIPLSALPEGWEELEDSRRQGKGGKGGDTKGKEKESAEDLLAFDPRRAIAVQKASEGAPVCVSGDGPDVSTPLSLSSQSSVRESRSVSSDGGGGESDSDGGRDGRNRHGHSHRHGGECSHSHMRNQGAISSSVSAAGVKKRGAVHGNSKQ
uniref:Palmitoyltransferase DHHC domain-containing protein n=1 Tax=Chromera velia CCMP2878 TaxID=1169474 RepID=A0A0G4IG98_9ALVE|eukprot:Cvel_14171.t1-p1 / transcript=Cvel_14171.t1 / gene=Cvel_14171 / organism=Chromera_velia_CCMP2878 / gene_product=Ankyrin-3, putative / transcript_product=Ankyrin-3, putative / location=Cvel_scaffold999:5351-13496(-) / protein_length=1186 / sequence_SO=supercontig / SO=protein_coding / is_pseudo=false